MTFRQKFGVSFMLKGQIWFSKLIVWIAGEITNEMLREYISDARPFIDKLGEAGARKGAAREAAEMESMFAKLAANVRPDSQWTFQKRDWGKLVIMVMPRVIDSNTALVMSGEGGTAKPGDVITLDGNPPNCDPAALHQFIQPEEQAI